MKIIVYKPKYSCHYIFNKNKNKTEQNMKNENRKYGIEIEAYNCDSYQLAHKLRENNIDCQVEGYNHQTKNHWKIVSDCSISGNQAFELVSPPLKGQDGLNQLRKVCEVLDAQNVKVNKSCGLHVHHEIRDYSSANMEDLFNLYKNAENEIDKLLPRSRRGSGNTYCKSLIHKNVNIIQIDRYHKLNLNSFEKYGTVEFRQHSGSIEFKKISSWIKLTQLMVEDAKTNRRSLSSRISWDALKARLGIATSATREFKNNIGGFIMKNLVEGNFQEFSNSKIADIVKENFANAKTTAASVAWYKSKLNREPIATTSNELGSYYDSRREALAC
jgi:hypothetical protein